MVRISKERVSVQLEKEEEEKMAKRKAMDDRELRRLTREARMMKEAKLKDAVVEKNTRVKDVIIKENDNLLSNLTLMKSRRRCVLDNKQAQNIANLFSQGDDLDAAIALEKNHIEDLESQIRKDTQNIQALKKKKGDNVIFCSEYLHKKEKERAERTHESWTSRLAAENTQLGLITKENEEMRKKLRRLMKEKGQFNQLFKELMSKLAKGKQVMADIVEQSRLKFQKRDEVSRKIEALRSRDKADLAKRMEEMQDLEKKMYEDKRLVEFRCRVQVLRVKMVGGLRSSHRESLERERMSKRLEKAHEFWDELKEVTEMSSADEVASHIMNEDSNLFSLFNFNNEIHDQLEVMMEKTAALMNTVDDEQRKAEDLFEQEIKSRNNMEKKLEFMEQNSNDLNDHCDANARLFSRLLDKINLLFDLMRCKRSMLSDLLGANTKVTEHNYKLYLGLIETEVIDALEYMDVAFPAVHSTATKSKSTIRGKTTTSHVAADRRIITAVCAECEGVWKRRIYSK